MFGKMRGYSRECEHISHSAFMQSKSRFIFGHMLKLWKQKYRNQKAASSTAKPKVINKQN
jgi:hypothetical protein